MAKITFLDESYTLWRLLSQTRSALFKARQKRVGQYIHFNLAAALVTTGHATVMQLQPYYRAAYSWSPTRCPSLLSGWRRKA